MPLQPRTRVLLNRKLQQIDAELHSIALFGGGNAELLREKRERLMRMSGGNLEYEYIIYNILVDEVTKEDIKFKHIENLLDQLPSNDGQTDLDKIKIILMNNQITRLNIKDITSITIETVDRIKVDGFDDMPYADITATNTDEKIVTFTLTFDTDFFKDVLQSKDVKKSLAEGQHLNTIIADALNYKKALAAAAAADRKTKEEATAAAVRKTKEAAAAAAEEARKTKEAEAAAAAEARKTKAAEAAVEFNKENTIKKKKIKKLWAEIEPSKLPESLQTRYDELNAEIIKLTT